MTLKTFPVEKGLLLTMLFLSAGLVALQYKWTDDLARAQVVMSEEILKNQAQSLCQLFDQQLSTGCLALVPDGDDISSVGFGAANLNRFAVWKAGPDRALFSRIAVVVPIGDGVRTYLINQSAGQMVPFDPPPEWAGLISNLAQKQNGTIVPFDDPHGLLFEYPVFGSSEKDGSRRESQWTVMELNTGYLKATWIPRLVNQFLDIQMDDMEIVNSHDRSEVILAARSPHTLPPVSIPFNRQGHSDGSPMGIKNTTWTLHIWPNVAKMQQTVSRTRAQSFFVAVLLDVLILCSVYMFVRYTRRARQLATAQMNFVAATSHELRTPLTVIRGAAHNLARGIVKEPGRIAEYAGLIKANAEQLTEMLEQVLAFANAQRTRLTLVLTTLDLSSLLAESITPLRQEMESAGITLDVVGANEVIVIQGDKASLVRAFQNLISNAIKHAGEGGWIGVEMKEVRANRMVQVSISDRGPGIPEAELGKIFEPFYRGSHSLERQTRGSGIGLSLVHEILQAHGGTISVNNRENKGAIFIIRLPINGKKS